MPKRMVQTSKRRGFDHVLELALSRRSFCRSAPAAVLSIGSFPSFDSLRIAASAGATPATEDIEDAYDLPAAVTWLVDQQLPDGGFPGPSGESDPETTISVVMLGTRVNAHMGRAHRYLLAHGPAYAATGPGQAARLALAGLVFLEDPTAFGGRETDTVLEDPPCAEVYDGGGVDLMSPIAAWFAAQVPGTVPGLVGRGLHDHAYVLLALSAYPLVVDFPDPATAIAPFEATQAGNGGWAVDGAADPNAADARTTSLVIQALVEWEWMEAPIVQRGLAYLRSLQTPDGAFASDQTAPRLADSASTAMAMQALLTTGADRSSPAWGDVRRALARFQMPSGGFRLRMSDDEPNLPATMQAMLALSNRFLPVKYYCD